MVSHFCGCADRLAWPWKALSLCPPTPNLSSPGTSQWRLSLRFHMGRTTKSKALDKLTALRLLGPPKGSWGGRWGGGRCPAWSPPEQMDFVGSHVVEEA